MLTIVLQGIILLLLLRLLIDGLLAIDGVGVGVGLIVALLSGFVLTEIDRAFDPEAAYPQAAR